MKVTEFGTRGEARVPPPAPTDPPMCLLCAIRGVLVLSDLCASSCAP